MGLKFFPQFLRSIFATSENTLILDSNWKDIYANCMRLCTGESLIAARGVLIITVNNNGQTRHACMCVCSWQFFYYHWENIQCAAFLRRCTVQKYRIYTWSIARRVVCRDTRRTILVSRYKRGKPILWRGHFVDVWDGW